LLRAVARALAAYEDRPAWRALQRRAMAARFSWDGAAAEYEELYADALARRRAGPRRAARERTEALA
jgi:starch synthase